MLRSCSYQGTSTGATTQLLRLVTPRPLAVQLPVLLQDQEDPSFHQDRDHDRHRLLPLLLRKYLTNCPTVGFLSTRDLAYWARRKVFRASARTMAV